jgi:hypothetical protein
MNSWLGTDSLDKLEIMLRASGMRAHSRVQLLLGLGLVLWSLWKALSFIVWVAIDIDGQADEQALGVVMANLHVVSAGVRACVCADACEPVYVCACWCAR